MDDMNNKENENQNEEAAFGSREYYKNLYGDMPEDVAEMLIGTHPLMKKEVSEELTNSIKIKSAQHKNLRAVEENGEEVKAEEDFEEPEMPSASKDPVEDSSEETVIEEARLHNRLGGKVSTGLDNDFEEPVPADDKSEDDLTAERIARMLGGVNVEEVEDEEDFEEVEEPVKTKKESRPERPAKNGKPRKKRKPISEKDLDLDNIDKQAGLNELFREDDDYYEEKHSGNGVARIVVIIVAVVVLAIFVYKVASLSGTVSKLEAQIETYKTMETEYEELKLEKLALEEKVETYEAQLTGGSTAPATPSTPSSNNGGSTAPSTPASNNAGAKTYTVKNGDTFWGIATKMYGNGAYYDKILKANGLNENDKIKEGMTLTIPAV